MTLHVLVYVTEIAQSLSIIELLILKNCLIKCHFSHILYSKELEKELSSLILSIPFLSIPSQKSFASYASNISP